jgi:sulfur carrier protein
MNIWLNGTGRKVSDEVTVGRLMDELGFQPDQVVVQVNLDIVRRERYPDRMLLPDDVVEILTFPSGG